MTYSEQWQGLWRKENRTRNLQDLINRRLFEDKFGAEIETKKIETETLDTDAGTGFLTIIKFMDGSVLETKELYLTDADDTIIFERRGHDFAQSNVLQ